MKQKLKKELVKRTKENILFVAEFVLDTYNTTVAHYNFYCEFLDEGSNLHRNIKYLEQWQEAKFYIENLPDALIPTFISFKSCYEALNMLNEIDKELDLTNEHFLLSKVEKTLEALVEFVCTEVDGGFLDKYRGVWFFTPLHNK